MENEQLQLYKQEFTANWDRAVYVDGPIDADMVKRLTPQILKLRQSGQGPITVAIDSPGGAVASMEALLGLLQGPDQLRGAGQYIAVVTNRACSAAADLVTFADYAVAYPHSKLLFHDVRLTALDDVTSAKAQMTLRALGEASERSSNKLADRIVQR